MVYEQRNGLCHRKWPIHFHAKWRHTLSNQSAWDNVFEPGQIVVTVKGKPMCGDVSFAMNTDSTDFSIFNPDTSVGRCSSRQS